MCQKAGFCPRVENQPNMLQTVLSLVEAEQGVSIVPACASRNFSLKENKRPSFRGITAMTSRS
jgi:hypothetical protein